MSDITQAYVAFATQYQNDRVGFVRTVLGVEPDTWQLQVLTELDAGATRIAIKSGHGVGKTALLSWIVLHFMTTRYPQKTVVTAPTSGQLFDALAAEVRLWLHRLPDVLKGIFRIKSDRIEHDTEPSNSFISYRTSRAEQPEALQGVHSDNVLLVGDEASGIPDPVYQAAGGSLSTLGSIFILAGNPTKAEGYFYNLFKKPTPEWRLHTVNGETVKRVDQTFIDQVAAQHGIDSNVYRVRVLGEFPTFNEDKLIPLYLIENAVERDVKPATGAPVIWGLDVNKSGSDRTALVERKTRTVTRVWERHSTFDLMEIVGWVRHLYETTPPSERPIEINVDAIGLGAGVADRGVEIGLPMQGVNVAEVAAMTPNAARLRDDLWLQTRDWFMRQDVSIPDNAGLIEDLQAPTYMYMSNGKMKVASKDEMRRAGFRSPDLGDALALTFASDAALTLYGSESTGSVWNSDVSQEPLAVV